MNEENGILWADSQFIKRENAHLAGVGDIFDRVLVELVQKMREMKMVSEHAVITNIRTTLD